jgi:hypothetical protein
MLPSSAVYNSPQNVGTCPPYYTASYPKHCCIHSHRQENVTSHQFRRYFPTTHFMLVDIANGFNPDGLQAKNSGTFIISALGHYQPLIQWIAGALLPIQADGIVKLHAHLHLEQQGWPTCSPQKKRICGPRSPE